MKEFWNERYSVKEYVYGKDPNTYFREKLEGLEPGVVLLPGEGEGRNAVYAAEKGWGVDAFDQSIEGQKKALALADERGVQIRYDLSDYNHYDPAGKLYDVIGLFFTHQPSDMRKIFHSRVTAMLKPGGLLILEGFHKEQIYRNTGGPKNPDFLFEPFELEAEFPGIRFSEIKKLIRELDEGLFHSGEAIVVQMTGIKQNS